MPSSDASSGSGIARFPHFVVVKGYHMGSKWFEGAFGAVPGCSFFFEFEHCLRDAKIRQLYGPPPPSTDLAPPEATLHYLRSSCGCGVGTAGRPPKEYTRRGNRCAGGCPNASLKGMTAPTRWLAALVYLGAIAGTLVSALVLDSGILVLVFIIVQFCTEVWYVLSYIPYGRRLCATCLQSAVGDV